MAAMLVFGGAAVSFGADPVMTLTPRSRPSWE
jgi:hypothetical protein